jgi:hypothetical protein
MRDLFSEDAELWASAGRFAGLDAIGRFYEDSFAKRPPHPIPGPLIISGDSVAVEIINAASAGSVRIADFFTVRDGKIASLSVYYGPTAE